VDQGIKSVWGLFGCDGVESEHLLFQLIEPADMVNAALRIAHGDRFSPKFLALVGKHWCQWRVGYVFGEEARLLQFPESIHENLVHPGFTQVGFVNEGVSPVFFEDTPGMNGGIAP